MRKIFITPFLKVRLIFAMVTLDMLSESCSESEFNSNSLKADADFIFKIISNDTRLLAPYCVRISRILYHLSGTGFSFDTPIGRTSFFSYLSSRMDVDDDVRSSLNQVFDRGYNNVGYAISLIASLVSQFV